MKEFELKSEQGDFGESIDYKNELNDEQFPAVQSGDGYTLVLAGAGSGKTRTIIYRVAWLLEHGIDASNILLLTFTNKAANEMISRVEGLLKRYPDGLWAGTFHSIANRILRRYGEKIGFTSSFSILDQDDSKQLITLIVKELKLAPSGVRFPSSAVLQSLISFQRNSKMDMESVLEMKHPKFLSFQFEIEEVQKQYRLQKAIQNSMDFDDLLEKFLELLISFPLLAEQLSTQFQYILVDEFQDTNIIQAQIVEKLSSVNKNLFVVGDDAQSIYSFRAANVRNILDFPKNFSDVNTFRLTKNYRSTPQILKLANESIIKNKEQFKKQLKAMESGGDLPLLIPAQSSRQEAKYIAEQIAKLWEDGESLISMAVLFRAAYHSQALEFELMKRDIPYEYRGGMKFFERAHIKDTIAHLRILHNRKDEMAWVRALKIHPGLGLITAQKLARLAGECEDSDSVLNLTVKAKRASIGWSQFLNVYKRVIKARGIADCIRAFLGSDEYQTYLEYEYPNFKERLDDLEQFALFAEQFDDVGAFLEIVSLTDEYGAVRKNKEDNSDRLILSTIHQSKGLEWNRVFVMHLAEGFFPNNKSLASKEGLEEERRLFYVAITRARRQLYMSYPITAGFEHVELKQPSIFLEELPDKLVEMVKLTTSMGGYQHTNNFDNEPTIVLDEYGERIKKPMPKSFLADYL